MKNFSTYACFECGYQQCLAPTFGRWSGAAVVTSKPLRGQKRINDCLRQLNGKVFLYLWVFITVGDVSLAVAGDAPSKPTGPHESPFTTTVDWYRPLPEPIKRAVVSKNALRIPHELITGVREPLIRQASIRLGRAEFVPITVKEARHFSGLLDPESILELVCRQRTEKIQFFEENPITGFTGAELERQINTRRLILDQLAADVRQFKQWRGTLRPYLIKAVTLGTRQGFEAVLVGDALIIPQVTLADHPLPMKRMPVVAFLPRAPKYTYTSVGILH